MATYVTGPCPHSAKVLKGILYSTPSPCFVRFPLVRFSFVRIFRTVPKYLVRALYPLFDRVNSSFVRKLVINVTLHIIDLICAFLVCAGFF